MRTFVQNLCSFLLLTIALNWVFVGFYERPDRIAIANKTHFKSQQYDAIQTDTNAFDLIFLGSSRGYSAFVPRVFDSVLGTRSYNMCTGSQSIIESYFILKEILRYQQPKTIIYETFLPTLDKTDDFYHILSNADCMGYAGRFDMLVNGFGMEGVVHYMFPALKHIPYLKIKIKNYSLSEASLSKPPAIQVDFDRGHIIDDNVVDSETIAGFPRIYSLDNTPLSSTKVEYYLPAFIQLCKDHGINLICVTAPYPPSRLRISPEDNASSYFRNLFRGYGVTYIDMNYLNERQFGNSDTYFSDQHHLNHRGAVEVSLALAGALTSGDY